MTKDEMKKLLKDCLSGEDNEEKVVNVAKLNDAIDAMHDEIATTAKTNQDLTLRMSEMILQSGNEKDVKEESVKEEIVPDDIISIIEKGLSNE